MHSDAKNIRTSISLQKLFITRCIIAMDDGSAVRHKWIHLRHRYVTSGSIYVTISVQ